MPRREDKISLPESVNEGVAHSAKSRDHGAATATKMGMSAVSDYDQMISDTTVVLAHEKIVPDVVEQVNDTAKLQIFYGDDSEPIDNGREMSLDDIAKEPKIVISNVRDTDVTHLLMVDPDMPSPHNPKYKDTLYWFVSNIKGKDFDSGDFLAEYMPPEPAQGRHRYCFLLFKSPDSAFKKFQAPAKRVCFQTKAWAKEHGLGDPAAAVYFVASHGGGDKGVINRD